MTLQITDCTASRHALQLEFQTAPQLADIEELFRHTIVFDAELEKVALHQPAASDVVPEAKAARLRSVKPLRGPSVTLVFDDTAPVTPRGTRKVNLLFGDLAADATRATHAVEDAVSYALLTEEIGGGAAPGLPQPSGRAGGPGSSPAQLVGQALRDVLGWKLRDDDPKGFSGALSASFTGREVDGHTEWTWLPRSYAVQTDLSGGITGAQASLYSRAKEVLMQSLPLLDGLYPLDPEADDEDLAAVKAVLRKQLEELVAELGTPGGPALTRIENYFDLLLARSGAHYAKQGDVLAESEPDQLGGTLGRLRDMLGLSFEDNLVNNVEDEQDQTNFRIMADHVTSLAQSWLNNRRFFGLDAKQPFLGTQLVPISRQLSVIAESVDELSFTLDSVFVGPAERQTLELRFGGHGQPMYAADFFRWIQNFVTAEAPTYVQDGGKFGIGNSLVPFAVRLHAMTAALLTPHANPHLPPGFHTTRVRRSIQSLAEELQELVRLATPLQRNFVIEPPPAQLRALTQAPRLVVVPGELTFIDKDSQPVTLLNLGDVALQVRAKIAGDDFVFVGADGADESSYAATIAPGVGLRVDIKFADKRASASTHVEFEGTSTQLALPAPKARVALKGQAPGGAAAKASTVKRG